MGGVGDEELSDTVIATSRSRVPWLLVNRGTAFVSASVIAIFDGTIDLLATALIALATAEGELSIVSVLASMYPVVTVLLAAAFLHERLLRSQYAGVALALAGVIAVAGG